MDKKEGLLIQEMPWEHNSFFLTFNRTRGFKYYNWGHFQGSGWKSMENISLLQPSCGCEELKIH